MVLGAGYLRKAVRPGVSFWTSQGREVTGAEPQYTIWTWWATMTADLHAKNACWHAKFVLPKQI
jgi:hypothetical protein